MTRLVIAYNFARKYSFKQHIKDDWNVTKLNMKDRILHPIKTRNKRKQRLVKLNKKYPKTAKALRVAKAVGSATGLSLTGIYAANQLGSQLIKPVMSATGAGVGALSFKEDK